MSENTISRRTFISAAGATGAAAVASGLAATSAQAVDAETQVAVNKDGSQTWSFMIAPDPIPEDQIVDTVDCEVLIVGAGISGCPAAAIASEKGADVVVLEKQGVICSTRPTGASWFGTQKMKDLGIFCTEEEKAAIVKDICGGANATSNQALVKLWLDESGEAGDYLTQIVEDFGINVQVGAYYGYYRHIDKIADAQKDMLETGGIVSDSYWNFYGLQHSFGNGDECGVCTWANEDHSDANWLYPVYLRAEENGARFFFNTRAVQLEREQGWQDDPTKRVTGCIATNENGEYVRYNASKGVILATGGFDWDDEMVACYYPIGLRTCRTWQTWMTGDGHKMGMWVGAKMEEQGLYNSHMMGTTAPAIAQRSEEMSVPDEFSAFIVPWKEWNLPSNALAPVLKVNQKGERFMNEEIGYFMSGPTIDKQPEGLFWAIWDGDSENKVTPHYFERLVDGIDTDEHSELMIERGMLIKADTIDELIEKMNAPEWDNGRFDGEKFKETLARYNELCENGEDVDWYKPAEFMTTVSEPPFYAAEMGTSWMTTLGGLEIDTKLHVLDTNRQPIPGLYAGGNPAGCFYGSIYAPQVPMSLCGHSTTLTYVAARNCVDGI